MINKLTKFLLPILAIFVQTQVFAFEGLVASELPLGGDVTVPGDFPVRVPPQLDVVFSGISYPQALTLTNKSAGDVSEVRLFAPFEKQIRVVKIQPGQSIIYNLKDKRPVRVRVTTGENLQVTSLQGLNIKR